MATFVCVNDLSSHAGEALNPKKFIEKRVSDGQPLVCSFTQVQLVKSYPY